MYNAEGFIKNALFSIQNQDFKDIEIIAIDDGSKDKSVNIVKEFMKKDPRIILIQNGENKGTLYTKTKVIFNSKGKYVMILDQDDLYIQKEALSTLYYEIETNNVDILRFTVLVLYSNFNLNQKNYIHYEETPILYQPDISKLIYIFTDDEKVKRVGDVIWNNIFKTELFIKIIKMIDDKFMNTKMNRHEDILLLFLLSRHAQSFKNIKRIFYGRILWTYGINPKINFCMDEKNKNADNYSCLSFLNYIEFLLINTNNTIRDKKIASYELKARYLNHECKNNQFTRERGIYTCKLYLKNDYIEKDVKNEITNFLNTINAT